MVLFRKLRSASTRLKLWRQQRQTRQKLRHEYRFVRQYLKTLTRNQPEVLLAANFLTLGGIRQHLLAIERYSNTEMELFPSDEASELIGRHKFENQFSRQVFDLPFTNLKTIHSHVFPWSIQLGRHLQSKGKRWVHTYHPLYTEADSVGEIPAWQREFNRSQIEDARHADTCISISKWQKDALQEEHGIESIYIPNGLDVARCDEASEERFRSSNDIQTEFILYVGRNDPVKNPSEFARLAVSMPDLQFVMAGRGLNSEYLKRTFAVDSPNNLMFLPELTPSQVHDAIDACQVLVIPSKREGLPTLALEAMARQKPIVATNEPGCSEALGCGAYGYLYENGDIKDLKAKVEKAIADEIKPPRARQRVLDHYDWRVIAEQLDGLYLNPSETGEGTTCRSQLT